MILDGMACPPLARTTKTARGLVFRPRVLVFTRGRAGAEQQVQEIRRLAVKAFVS